VGILVLSGDATAEDAAAVESRPDMILADTREIGPLLLTLGGEFAEKRQRLI
jgi:hypothetical protein